MRWRDRDAGPDGYARMKRQTRLWNGLAKGCAAGWHDLSALWFDNGQMHMALSESHARKRAIFSLCAQSTALTLLSAAIMLPRCGLNGRCAISTEQTPSGCRMAARGSIMAYGQAGRRKRKKATASSPSKASGLHQIPVGPVHAGIIEPGHFRFTANGETIARLEERLGYVHKGVEALCAGASIDKAAKLRRGSPAIAPLPIVSRSPSPSKRRWAGKSLSALHPARHHGRVRAAGEPCERCRRNLQRRQRHRHPGPVRPYSRGDFKRKRPVLRSSHDDGSHRAGGRRLDVDKEFSGAILALMDDIETSFVQVARVYDQSPSLQNRTVGTGFARPDFVRQFAAGGYVGRAAGRDFDARAAFAYASV